MAETRTSLWLKQGPTTSYPALAGSVKADVAVIGAGIAGLTTAFLLKKAGVNVAVIEAHQVGSGATGNTTAKITSLHQLIYARLASAFGEETAHIFGASNQAAILRIESLTRELSIDCHFHRLPAYTYTEQPERVPEIEAEVEAAQKAGLPAHYLQGIDLPFSAAAAVRFDDQAHFNPYAYCAGLAGAIDGDGSRIFEKSRAVDIEGNLVKGEAGEVTADQIVVATQLPFIDKGGAFVGNYPQRSYLLAIRIDGDRPEGMYISAESPIRSISHAAGSDYLLVGGESHKTGQDADTRQRYGALRDWAARHFPVRSVDFEWSSQDFMPADGMPYIGRLLPFTDRIYTATGFGKWGMTRGTLAGMILSDLILGRENPWAETFSRLNPLQSAADFFTENMNVSKRFVQDRLSALGSPDPESLPPEQGDVIRTEGGLAATYREEDGALHTVSPVCTHLGCYVTWNTAEKSWDCPCHGSRYRVDGTMLTGPTVKDLPRVESKKE